MCKFADIENRSLGGSVIEDAQDKDTIDALGENPLKINSYFLLMFRHDAVEVDIFEFSIVGEHSKICKKLILRTET